MNRLYWSRFLLIAILMGVSAISFAQKNTNTTWKKEVGREIEVTVKEDEKEHHLRKMDYDTSLLEMIMTGIKTGKVNAWSNYDAHFTTKITFDELIRYLTPPPDTIIIEDPVSGREIKKIRVHDFDPSAVHRYRVLEEWTFNPVTGNTDIHIEGIAPVRDVVIDGDFRGWQALFWVRYNDILSILQHYDQYHPDNTLASRIWYDYFLSDVKPAEIK